MSLTCSVCPVAAVQPAGSPTSTPISAGSSTGRCSCLEQHHLSLSNLADVGKRLEQLCLGSRVRALSWLHDALDLHVRVLTHQRDKMEKGTQLLGLRAEGYLRTRASSFGSFIHSWTSFVRIRNPCPLLCSIGFGGLEKRICALLMHGGWTGQLHARALRTHAAPQLGAEVDESWVESKLHSSLMRSRLTSRIG
eukprot:1047260-Pelagomonas_calceolata.AAC.7